MPNGGSKCEAEVASAILDKAGDTEGRFTNSMSSGTLGSCWAIIIRDPCMSIDGKRFRHDEKSIDDKRMRQFDGLFQ